MFLRSMASAGPVLHVTLQVTLPRACVGTARETVRGGEGATSDFTGLSAFCAAGGTAALWSLLDALTGESPGHF